MNSQTTNETKSKNKSNENKSFVTKQRLKIHFFYNISLVIAGIPVYVYLIDRCSNFTYVSNLIY